MFAPIAPESKGLPQEIDPARLADEGAHLEGRLSIGQLPRLASLCVNPAGGAHVLMDFERTMDGKRIMRLRAGAEAVFECGRCLGEVTVTWQAESQMIIRRPAEVDESAPDMAESLVTAGPVLLRDVVEDELLLAVPMYPVHSAPCRTPDAPGPVDIDRGQTVLARSSGPFAALARLKRGLR